MTLSSFTRQATCVSKTAVNRAGPLLGRKVLVIGCGPIGAMVIIAARRAGATVIVATDEVDQPLRKVLAVGADEVINVAQSPQDLAKYAADKGQFDVLFEASGNERALRAAFDVVRPRGGVVQVGLSGTELTLPYRDARRAFALAADRTQSMKVLLNFD